MGSVMLLGGEKHLLYPHYNPVFADNTWAQVIRACRRKEVPATWLVGNQLPMTINGAEYIIDIIGRDHDDYADGSGKAPLTFQLHDCYGTKYAMNGSTSNAGGWENCIMRISRLPAILTLMPSEVRAGVREVKKLSSAGNQSSTRKTTTEKLFLLAEAEVVGGTAYGYGWEGTQYAYYKDGNTKIKTFSGSVTDWWERSPSSSSSTDFACIATGGTAYTGYASEFKGVSFAFCF